MVSNLMTHFIDDLGLEYRTTACGLLDRAIEECSSLFIDKNTYGLRGGQLQSLC